jgi:spermidine synthase
MALGWSTDDQNLRSVSVETLQSRFDRIGFKTEYYTPAIHAAAFALPAFIAKQSS